MFRRRELPALRLDTHQKTIGGLGFSLGVLGSPTTLLPHVPGSTPAASRTEAKAATRMRPPTGNLRGWESGARFTLWEALVVFFCGWSSSREVRIRVPFFCSLF